MRSLRNRQRKPLSGFQAASERPVDGAEPAEIAVEVFRGHAAELTQPVFEPTVVRIDVLHMIDACDDTDACGQINRPVGDAQGPGGGQCFAAVGTQDDVLGQNRLESDNDLGRIVGAENEIRSASRAVTRHEHRHLFAGQSALAGFPAPLARRATEILALALSGAQEEGFVGFLDADKRLSLHGFRQGEKPVTPAVRRADADIEPIGNLVQRKPVTQRRGMLDPLAAHVQSGERRAGQGAKGLGAAPALVALPSTSRPVLDHPLGRTVRTGRHAGQPPLDYRRCRRPRVQRRQLGCQFLPLRRRHLLQRRRPSFHFSVPLLPLPASAPPRHNTSMQRSVARHVSLSVQLEKRAKKSLGDGSEFGLDLAYAIQPSPDGLPQAFLIGEVFLNGAPAALVLGDNLLFGQDLTQILAQADARNTGATVFGYRVKNPSAFGVVEFDDNRRVLSIEEKPSKPRSHYAVPGLYFYDEHVCHLAKTLKPSQRGELEITDLNRLYLQQGELYMELLGRGCAWLDMGTHESLHRAAVYVESIQSIQGYQIANLEEIALRKGWISPDTLQRNITRQGQSSYSRYLQEILTDPGHWNPNICAE